MTEAKKSIGLVLHPKMTLMLSAIPQGLQNRVARSTYDAVELAMPTWEHQVYLQLWEESQSAS